MQSVADQIFSFLMVTLLGCLVGIIFDSYVIIRRFWRPNQWGTVIGDFVFSLIVTFFAYAFLLLCTWGEVRIYVFLAIALGFFINLKIISQHIRKMLAFLFFRLKE